MYSQKDFTRETESYKKEKFSCSDDIILFNRKMNKSAHMAIAAQIEYTSQFYNSIYIFLSFAFTFTTPNQYKFLQNFNINFFNTINLKLFKENLEFDIKELLGLQLNIEFNFSQQDLCYEKFTNFVNSSFTYTSKNTQIEFYLLAFLLSKNISYIPKDNLKQKKFSFLVDFLVFYLKKKLTICHTDDANLATNKKTLSFLIFFTTEWLGLYLRSNIFKNVTEVECEIVYSGFLYFMIDEKIYYKYAKYSIVDFINCINDLKGIEMKKMGKLLFNYICFYFVGYYFEHENFHIIIQNIQTLHIYINTNHPNL